MDLRASRTSTGSASPYAYRVRYLMAGEGGVVVACRLGENGGTLKAHPRTSGVSTPRGTFLTFCRQGESERVLEIVHPFSLKLPGIPCLPFIPRPCCH